MKGGESPVHPPISKPKKKRRRLWLVLLPAVLLALFLLNLFLQNVWAHLEPPFSPGYDRADLSPVLAQDRLTQTDYDLIFQQTGLARPAVDSLLGYGEAGIRQILQTQDAFFSGAEPSCQTLIGGRFTCEDRFLDEDGKLLANVPLAPLQDGDILVTFSTHTFGWRHGHAGLVTDAEKQRTLEATVMFYDSSLNYAWHWRTYSNFMLLRVKDADIATREAVVDFALEHLNGIPYHLTSGIFGPKAPEPDQPLYVQCAYLPWYAWQAFGLDLDSDGGRIVTVLDLAQSPELEVVQVYGIDPRTVAERFHK